MTIIITSQPLSPSPLPLLDIERWAPQGTPKDKIDDNDDHFKRQQLPPYYYHQLQQQEAESIADDLKHHDLADGSYYSSDDIEAIIKRKYLSASDH